MSVCHRAADQLRICSGSVVLRRLASSSSAATNEQLTTAYDEPVPKGKGKFQFWRPPVYVGPYVSPLQKGPDYSVLNSHRPLVTSRSESLRLKHQLELGKQIVKALGEIKLAEDLHAQSVAEQRTAEAEKAKWTPKEKAAGLQIS